jgi:soluble lytic murein transglycosylase
VSAALLRLLAIGCAVTLAAPLHAQAREGGQSGSRPAAGVDLAVFRDAVNAAERGDVRGATERQQRLPDPVARKVVEWFVLRSGAESIGSARFMRWLAENRHWPATQTLRGRAEVALLSENRPAAEVVAFFQNAAPRTAHGRLALATALKAQGQGERANALVREAWRSNDVPQSLERIASERFPGVISRADEIHRMHRVFFKERATEGLRLAQRLGGNELAIGRARAAVINQASNAGALLEAVPQAVRRDPGYIFARVQWLRRADRHREAAQLLLAAPREQRVLIDPDEWWTERRLVSRKVLEEGDPRTAYRVASGHSARRDIERMEAEFTAGWIALRFLQDHDAADRHFAQLQRDAVRSISVARGAYWRGRTAEARGDRVTANGHYETAARHRSTYYGQLAMARLGRTALSTNGSPRVDEGTRARFERREPVRAIRLLAAAGLVDKTRSFFADMGDEFRDPEELALLSRLATEIGQVRFSVMVAKLAVQRGIHMDYYAFPTNGMPNVPSAGPPVERALVLALARQESLFDPRARSSAGAVGLMQMLPSSAQQTARRFNVAWQPGNLTDPAYNTRLGSAYLGEVIQEFGGSYILAFAAYNAGRGRVREWLTRFGDPRNPTVDPVDWVERIPFSETRNYVMRVMENLQIYRARLNGASAQLRIEQDLRRREAVPAAAAAAQWPTP